MLASHISVRGMLPRTAALGRQQQSDANERPDRVDGHVVQASTPGGDKGLVKFIGRSEASSQADSPPGAFLPEHAPGSTGRGRGRHAGFQGQPKQNAEHRVLRDVTRFTQQEVEVVDALLGKTVTKNPAQKGFDVTGSALR